MRFLMVVSGYPPAKSAGMERGAQRLATALVRRGHPVLVLTAASPGQPEIIKEEGVVVHRALRPWAIGALWGLTYMEQVRRHALRLRPQWDFLLAHKLDLHSVVLPGIARRTGRPCATLLVNAGLHSDLARLRQHRGGGWLLAQALRCPRFFALSRQSEEELRAAGVAPERIGRYRYFVDTAAFAPGTEPRSASEFVFVGRFHTQKNLPLLLRAFEAVHARHPQARLRLVGKGPEEETLRDLHAASPARDAIRIEGWTADPAALYRSALAVVTASNAEGLSNVLVEAIACGAPVLTTDVSGARDVLDPGGVFPAELAPGRASEGEAGLLAPVGDGEALAHGMARLLTEPALRDSLAERARARALAAYTEEACVAEFLRQVLPRG